MAQDCIALHLYQAELEYTRRIFFLRTRVKRVFLLHLHSPLQGFSLFTTQPKHATTLSLHTIIVAVWKTTAVTERCIFTYPTTSKTPHKQIFRIRTGSPQNFSKCKLAAEHFVHILESFNILVPLSRKPINLSDSDTLPMARILSSQVTTMATCIPATPLLNASQHEKAMLIDIYELLNTLFARNRNQHRRSHWWRSLHAFRKQLSLLLSEMETGRKSERPSKIEARLRFWDEKCVHVWYW